MSTNMLARLFIAASLALAAQSALAQSAQMTPAQILKPAELTPKELKYYQTLGAAAAKEFIATRSYVRLARKVVAHEMPAAQLPEKPAGFSVAYLLRGEQAVIDQAIAASLAALMQMKTR